MLAAKGSILAVGIFLGGFSSVFGQAPDTVHLEQLTCTELRDLIKSHQTTIILPIGGTEQNGPHMALGKRNT